AEAVSRSCIEVFYRAFLSLFPSPWSHSTRASGSSPSGPKRRRDSSGTRAGLPGFVVLPLVDEPAPDCTDEQAEPLPHSHGGQRPTFQDWWPRFPFPPPRRGR